MKTVGFFNLKSGVGTTTLVYHLAWMYQELGIGSVVLDLDPQADLTAAFLPDESWLGALGHKETVLEALAPLLRHEGPLRQPLLQELADHLSLLPGDLDLSLFEDRFADAWSQCAREPFGKDHDAFHVLTSFYQVAHQAAQLRNVQLVIMDIGPGAGAIQRSALLACDSIVIPLGTDPSSIQSLSVLGPTLRKWRTDGQKLLREHTSEELPSSLGTMEPLGYVIAQRTGYSADYSYWGLPQGLQRLSQELSTLYYFEILGEPDSSLIPDPDPYRLATLRHSTSLMPLAQAAHKPMFLLKPADGAIGSYAEAVQDCYRDFKQLALRIASASGISSSAS